MAPDVDRQATLAGLFSPAAPITEQQLFAGRQGQMDNLLHAIEQVGQHAVIFGERGVGKTSIAATMAANLRGTDLPVLTTCDSTDSFSSIWRKTLEEIAVVHELPGVGFAPQASEVLATAADRLPLDRDLTPNDVRKIAQEFDRFGDVIIVIDEFDNLDDGEAKGLFADTMKILSDRRLSTTLVLVGVADNVEELIAEHQSVERAIVQIPMPRMSTLELKEIIDRIDNVGMSITEEAKERITRLSQGLPHYTHLLSKAAALAADERDSHLIEIGDVDKATEVAMQNAQEGIIRSYYRATMSSQGTLYPQVLLACALTRGDDLGYFSAADVRAPLAAILGKPIETRSFSRHLNQLSDQEAERGTVLQKIGPPRKLRFRFLNPLLQPFVIMKGLADGLVDGETLQQFRD